MAVNKVNFGGNTLIDLTGDTLDSAEQLLKGIIAHAKDGSVITGQMEAGGSGMTVIQGTFTCAENTMSYEVVHNLGKIPKIWCYMLATKEQHGITNEANPTYRFVIGCSFWEPGQVFNITKIATGFSANRPSYDIFDRTSFLTSINETSITFGSTSMNAKYSAFKANTKYMWFVAG